MSEIIFVVLLIVFGVLLYYFNGTKKSSSGAFKSTAKTKADIVKNYKKRMDLELKVYVDDPKVLMAKKTSLVKVIASELNRNIFFDEDEVRELVQELILYEIKGS